MDPVAFPIFLLISGFVRSKFDGFMNSAFIINAAVLANLSLIVVTLWVSYRGFRIASGVERANLTDFVYKSAKIVFILALISASITGNTWLQDAVFGFRSQVVSAVTGSNTAGGQQVQNGLSAMDLAFSLGTIINPDSGAGGGSLKSSGVTLAMLGQASPQIAGGVLLLINELGLRIGILLLPIFLFLLIFERTQDLFFSWARTMMGSFFNMAILAITVGIAADLVIVFVGALTAITASVEAVPGAVLSEIQTSILQSGFGIMLTALIITVPTIAGRYFTFMLEGGSAGNFFSGIGNSSVSSQSSNANAAAGAAAQQRAAAGSASATPTASNPVTGATAGAATGPGGPKPP
jgi:type IV secretion system protein VirB6